MATNRALKTVLVVGVYMMHKLAKPDDPMVFFYGDGAGAAVLERSEEPGFVAAPLRADRSYARNLPRASGGTVEPASCEAVTGGRTAVKMVERYPPEINNTGWAPIVRDVAQNGRLAGSDTPLPLLTQGR